MGEGPNEYTSNLVAASFNDEEGGYYTLSSRDFLSFNEKWEVKKRIRFASHIQIIYYTGPRHKVPYYMLPGISEPYVFTNFFSGTNPVVGDEGDEITSKYLIELYNPQKDDLEWVLPNDPHLLPDFELNDNNKQTKPIPVFALDSEANLMYLTFERGQEIGVYDLANDFELIEKVSFNHENFTRTNKSKNVALVNFGPEIFGVLYFSGLSEGASQAQQAADPDYSPIFDPSLYRLIVVQNGIQQENEIEFPLSCEPRSEILQLPDNRILLHDKYMGKGEPEYSSYSIFELKPQ